MRLPEERHLAYCTNVHAGESAAEVMDSLRRVAAPVRQRLGVESLGIGLYLSHRAAGEVDPARLGDQLAGRGLYAFTFNGFPYGGFHAGRVEEALYRPGWTDPLRAARTPRPAPRIDRIAPPAR